MAKRRSRGQTPDGAKSRPNKTRATPSRRRTRSSVSGASDDTGSTPRGAAARSTPRRRSRRSVEPADAASASGAGSGAGAGSGRRGSSGRGSSARGRGPGGKVLLARHGQLEELETLFMTATSDFMASDQAKKLLRSAAQKRVVASRIKSMYRSICHNLAELTEPPQDDGTLEPVDAALQARVADLESQVTAAAEEVKASRETVVQSLREQAQKAANDFKDDVMADDDDDDDTGAGTGPEEDALWEKPYGAGRETYEQIVRRVLDETKSAADALGRLPRELAAKTEEANTQVQVVAEHLERAAAESSSAAKKYTRSI